MSSRIRIESRGDIVTDDRIFYLPDWPRDEEWECQCFVGYSPEFQMQPGTRAKCERCGTERPEAEPVDISNCVQGYELHGWIGDVRRATLSVILVQGHTTAEIEDVIVRRLGPTRFRRLRYLCRRTVAALKRRVARSLRPELQREIAKNWARSR